MNQILTTEYKKTNKGGPLAIKPIVKFFAIVIMVFGLILAGEGSYAIYKNIEDSKPKITPTVTIHRVNDKAIINIEHNVKLIKLTYSWNNGEENVIPINDFTAQEEITLLGNNSTLYLKVEDTNGEIATYEKHYILEGVDITKPTIEISTENGSNTMTITAKDETEIASITYQWEGEEETTQVSQTQGQKEIVQQVTLTPGQKKIKITAKDKNNNIEEIEKEVQISTSKPKMQVIRDHNQIIISASDADGIKDIVVNLNGKKYAARDLNRKEVKVGPLTLQEGNNTISVEVTNVNGYTQKATTELQSRP